MRMNSMGDVRHRPACDSGKNARAGGSNLLVRIPGTLKGRRISRAEKRMIELHSSVAQGPEA